MVGPGKGITIEVDPPTEAATVSVEYDGLAQALTAVIVSAEILAWVHGKVPFTESKSVEQILTVVDIVGCVTGAGIDDFLRMAVERVTGRPLPKENGPRRAGDPPAPVAKTERIRRVLDWSPNHDDLDEIVASAIAWERSLAGS